MCMNFNGSHSGGSTFVNVNDCWLLQKLLYTTDISSALKKKIIIIRSPSIWFRNPKPVQIRQSGQTGIGGVTWSMRRLSTFHTSRNVLTIPLVLLNPKRSCIHVSPIKTSKIRIRVTSALYANAMHVINNIKILQKKNFFFFQNHFVEPPKPRL